MPIFAWHSIISECRFYVIYSVLLPYLYYAKNCYNIETNIYNSQFKHLYFQTTIAHSLYLTFHLHVKDDDEVL